MKYIIYGGSGFLGTAITKTLIAQGHKVLVCDIKPPSVEDATFLHVNLLESIPGNELLESPDVVINLAGKLIFARWNEKVKKLIYDTRVVGTRNIVALFKEEKYRPTYLVNASAVGIYGDRGEEKIDEESGLGDSFLAGVVKDWEHEALQAREHGVQVRIFRNALILGKGGMLEVLLPFYKWGIGGPLGNGMQWMPWIHIDDITNLYISATKEHQPEIVNAVAPAHVRNQTFSRVISQIVHRPHVLFIPKIVLRLLYGEFTDEIMVSQRATSMYSSDVKFAFPDLQGALAEIIEHWKS
jgi:uncharacterized protein (TIGR01777 family)